MKLIILLTILGICIISGKVIGEKQSGFMGTSIFFYFVAPFYTTVVMLIIYPILYGFNFYMLLMLLPLSITVSFLAYDRFEQRNYAKVYDAHHSSIERIVLNNLPIKDDIQVSTVYSKANYPDKLLSKLPGKLSITVYIHMKTDETKEKLYPVRKELKEKISSELSKSYKKVFTHFEFNYHFLNAKRELENVK